MIFNKKIWLPVILSGLLSACGAYSSDDTAAPPDEAFINTTNEITSDVIFTYNNKEYDLQERNPDVNALMEEITAGGVIVVEGHIGLDNGYYGIFDTKTETFVKDIEGANLTWRDDDISTAAYTLWSEIYDYDGNLLADLDLSESEYISDLSWRDNGHLSVEISSINDEARDIREIAVD